MRLVFKDFGITDRSKSQVNNLDYRQAHYVTLTTEEPSDLALAQTRIVFSPAGYYNQNDPAQIVINEDYSSQYRNWKRAQAEEPDLSLLVPQYIAFWTAWNAEAEVIIAEQKRIQLEKEAAETAKNKELIESTFKGIIQFEKDKVIETFSYLAVKHNYIDLIHKSGVIFNIAIEYDKWNLHLKSDLIGNYYHLKKSKHLKTILNWILDEPGEIKYTIDNHLKTKEKRRKEEVLRKKMNDAGWTQDYGTRYIKRKESGKYYADAQITEENDIVYITNIRRHIENLKMVPHDMDISIFE